MVVTKHLSDGRTAIGNFMFEQEVFRRDLVEMIILHEYPLSVVGQVGFKKFVNNLKPLFRIPTRNMIRSDVIKLYKDMMKNTMDLIDNNDSRIAITTDMWTADNQKKGYMAVTAHFVDSSWQLQQRLIRFCYVPAPHTVDVIVEYIYNVLLDWNMDSKLSTITVDNCNVNDGVVESLLCRIDNDNLLFHGSFLHMRCTAHILNLIVKEGLDVIGSSLEKIRDSCVFWSGTPKRIENFEEIARQLRITSTKKLCYDVKTRWNSTYIMLETTLKYKDVFPRLNKRDAQYTIKLCNEDWDNAKIMCEILKIFFEITKLFSGTKYTTANHYFAKIWEVKLALCCWLEDVNPTMVNMASGMLQNFEKYWSEIHGIMGIATILDLRFKVKMLYYYKDIYRSDCDAQVEKIVHLCRDLIREYQRKYSQQQADDSCSGGEGVDDTDQVMKFYNWAAQSSKKQRTSSELDHYLEEDIVVCKVDFNVLNWWNSYGTKFPILQKIARDIYAIPVSNVASESKFSMGGRLISPQRNRLHPDLVEALACAQSWLKFELETEKPEDTHFKTLCDEDVDEDGCEDSAVTDV